MSASRLATIGVVMAWCTAISLSASAQDLTITDAKGNVIELRAARIDYTSYSIIYTHDFESTGIRAYQGEGVVTIPWSRIQSVTILRMRNDRTPYRFEADMVLREQVPVGVIPEIGGKPETLTPRRVDLVVPTGKGIVGQTDLGAFSIPLQNVQKITVRRQSTP
jgi:hypothetical protein